MIYLLHFFNFHIYTDIIKKEATQTSRLLIERFYLFFLSVNLLNYLSIVTVMSGIKMNAPFLLFHL